MKLKDILKEALMELDDGFTPINGDDSVLEFPHSNFSISVFRDEKKLLFTPQNHQSIPTKIRTFVNDLKQNFRVSEVSQKELGAFEITLDPRTDLDTVLDYIKQTMEEDGNL